MVDPKLKSVAQLDLLELPGIRHLRRYWFLRYLRGEHGNMARTLLFSDLAEALAQRLPLDQTLELMAIGHQRAPLPLIPWTEYRKVINPEYFVHRLAIYLLPHIRKGLSLSQAMTRLGRVFSQQEVRIVELGEAGGYLPEALRRLADYRQTDQRLQQVLSHLQYPMILAIIAGMIVSFILITIIPKYAAIFAELGGELPASTLFLIQVSYLVVHRSFVLVMILLAFLLVRTICYRRTGYSPMYSLPFFRGLLTTVREARWMAAFTLLLQNGTPADAALRGAGEISGGRLERQSQAAADLVAAGAAIGEACVRARVLTGWINHRLLLIDWRGDYIANVRAIVHDADRHVMERLVRFGQRLELAAILTMGAILGCTALALYLPLFMIPRIVMAQG